MYVNNKGKIIKDNEPYNSVEESDGRSFPRNWDKDTIPELHKVIEVAPPEETQNVTVTGFIVDESYTQVWQVRNKTKAEKDDEVLMKRFQALYVEWPDAFTLLDDILNQLEAAGVTLPAKTLRDTIKEAHPKPV